MAFTYRFAREEDIEAIAEIEVASMSCPWTLAAFSEAIKTDHSFILIAESDGVVAGYSVFYLTPPESELPDIVVDEKYRGQGLGRKLLEESIEILKSKEIDTIFLEVRESNMPARTLYEHIGFEQIGKRKYFYSNPIEDAICMRLTL